MSNANTQNTASPLLQVQGLQLHYGGIAALKGVDLEVRSGELVALIGSNGAGKSSVMKALTRTHPISAGRIQYLGQDTATLQAWDLVAQGLVLVPEGRGVFARMSIDENLRMGAYLHEGAKSGKVISAQTINDGIEHVFTTFPRLKERRKQLAGTLSGGEQQMLAMGRALMSRPRLLLLDEPSMGLAPIMVDKVFEVIQNVAAQGVSVLLVEQNAQRALQIAQRAYVLASGLVSHHGSAADLMGNPSVQAAYLGV